MKFIKYAKYHSGVSACKSISDVLRFVDNIDSKSVCPYAFSSNLESFKDEVISVCFKHTEIIRDIQIKI